MFELTNKIHVCSEFGLKHSHFTDKKRAEKESTICPWSYDFTLERVGLEA